MNRAFTLLAGVVLIAACGSEPDDKIFGSYTLVAIQGSLIPYHDFELSEGDCDVFVTEGELVLEPSGSYSLEFSGPRNCTGGEPPATVGRLYSGTVSQSNGQLAFTAEVEGAAPLQFTGTVNPLEAIVTVPPIPPQTGSNLTLQFAAAQ